MTRRSRILLILVVVVGVLAICAAWIVIRSQQAADALTSARAGVTLVREDLVDGRTFEAAQKLAVVQGDTARAVRATSDPVFGVASVLPVIGTTPAAVSDVAEAADALALDALPDLLEAGTALSPDALRANGDQINLAAFETASPALDSAAASLSAITADVAGIDTTGTPAKVQDAVASLQTELDDVLVETQSAARGAALVPPMLGADQPRQYFLALQSNNEARGTGGLFGSFGVISADDGRVRIRQLAPRSRLDDQVYDKVPLDFGPDYAALYGDDPASWVNANLSPHYPYAAQLWLKMWKDRTGEQLDGVITTDPVALSYLLKATGPVTLPDGRTISADNVVSFTENEIYFEIEDDAERDAYLQSVAEAALEAVFSGDAAPRALIDALGKAADERRLLVYSDRVNEQMQLAASSVSGALPGDGAPFAGLATINGGGNKLDYYLGQSLSYELLGCTADGGRRGQITVTYENTAPGDGSLPLYIAARADRPPGPDGLAPNGNGDSFFFPQVYATAGSSLVSAMQDGKPITVEQGKEQGHTVFRTGVELPAGASTTLVFEVAEPPAEGELTTFVTPLVKPAEVDADTRKCSGD
ncbi:MAG: DUF4012 domain-containing protein [Actinomycetes bacterium]